MKNLHKKIAKVSSYAVLTIAVTLQLLLAPTAKSYAVDSIAPLTGGEPEIIKVEPSSEPEIILNDAPQPEPTSEPSPTDVPASEELPQLPQLPDIKDLPSNNGDTKEDTEQAPPIIDDGGIKDPNADAPFKVSKDANVKMYYNRSVEQYVVYGFTIYNGNTNKFPGGRIIDYLPAGVEAQPSTGWMCNDMNEDGIITNGEPCEYEAPVLGINEFFHVDLTVKVQFNLDNMSQICNTATVVTQDYTVSSPADCRPVVNEPVPISVFKETPTEVVYDGFENQYLNYDIVIFNNSDTRTFPGATMGVYPYSGLIEVIPEGTVFAGGDEWTCFDTNLSAITGDAGDECYANVPTIAPGQYHVTPVSLLVLSNLSALGEQLCNQVAVIANDSGNSKVASNNECVEIIHNTDNDFSLVKTANVTQVYRGQITEIVYTLTLTNYTNEQRSFNFVDRVPEGVVAYYEDNQPTWIDCQDNNSNSECDGGDLVISDHYMIEPLATYTVNFVVYTDDLTNIDQIENLAGAFLDRTDTRETNLVAPVSSIIEGEDCGNEYLICSNLHLIAVVDMPEDPETPETPEDPQDPNDDGTVLGTSTGGTLANTGFNLVASMTIAGATVLTGAARLALRKRA